MISYQKKLYRKEYAKELFKIAIGDYESALALSEANLGRQENILYLVQQSVKKSLKALLVYNQIAFPLVHDLGALVALLPDDLMPPAGFDLIELNPFGTIRRYEDSSLPLSSEDIDSGLKCGKDLIEWVKLKIELN